ncbi:acyltransferase family protein [Candidatus Nitrotoga fabula]|uniref:acyltransferase family protein n=1 Tax=Candidatus Nitrotoga fabula TaxID=2182327 RepID=UPI003B96992E
MKAPAASLSHPKYRPDIDGLRAIAVLSVVGFHAFPEWVNGGFIGVDIFFVISGFLIPLSCSRTWRTGLFALRNFTRDASGAFFQR